MKYGDYDNVTKDSKSIYDIINRQGSSLLLDCIAEHTAQSLSGFKCVSAEKRLAMKSILGELKEAFLERI